LGRGSERKGHVARTTALFPDAFDAGRETRCMDFQNHGSITNHRSVDTLGDWVGDAEMSTPALASFEPTSFLLTGNLATRSA
jgi:hypothetical protein